MGGRRRRPQAENTDSILFSQATHTKSLRRQSVDRCHDDRVLWQRKVPQDAEPSLYIDLSLSGCSRRGGDRACQWDWGRVGQQG